MANQTLFSTKRSRRAPATTTVNKAGGRAYKLEDAEILAQYVVTSCFNDVYYASAGEQLEEVKRVCETVSPEIIAKAAVYGHESGGMKDVPAYLLAVLAAKGEIDLLRKAFPRVIRNPKMLLNFVQIIRSGVTGRKSFGSAVKRLINDWIVARRGNKLFLASIGYKNPSLVDVIKMTHPRPSNEEQDALFGYLLERDFSVENLPPLVKQFNAFKADNTNPLPDMDWRALTSCNLTDAHWKEIAMNMPWNTLRMNLNNLSKHKVFTDSAVVDHVVNKLRDVDEVRKWNVFPYQLLTTFKATQYSDSIPKSVSLALQDAMEIATENVPKLGNVAVCVDVSGSMDSCVTGNRRFSYAGGSGGTSCRDVAALIAASVARTNQEATIISFGTQARIVPGFNPRDSVMTNSQKLSSEANYCGHGTNAGEAMKQVVRSGEKFDLIVFATDCQSWIENRNPHYWSSGTGLMGMWEDYKGKNKKVKIAEINLQPYGDSQLANSDPRVMNIGGMSNEVFTVLEEFTKRSDNINFLKVLEDSVEL